MNIKLSPVASQNWKGNIICEYLMKRNIPFSKIHLSLWDTRFLWYLWIIKLTHENTNRFELTKVRCSSAKSLNKEAKIRFIRCFLLLTVTCSTKGNTEFDVNEVVCPPNCQSYNVYGNELYSDNSSVCASAIHAGVIGMWVTCSFIKISLIFWHV